MRAQAGRRAVATAQGKEVSSLVAVRALSAAEQATLQQISRQLPASSRPSGSTSPG